MFYIYVIVLQGVPANSLRFLFEGQRIADNQTPKEVCIPPSLHEIFIIFIFIPSFDCRFYSNRLPNDAEEPSGSRVSLEDRTSAGIHRKEVFFFTKDFNLGLC